MAHNAKATNRYYTIGICVYSVRRFSSSRDRMMRYNFSPEIYIILLITIYRFLSK